MIAFGDSLSRCHSVDYLVHSEIVFSLIRNCFGIYNCTRSALINRTGSSHHLSGALAVALIILQVGALVGTLDIRPVLGALISNCWLRSPVFLRVCFPLNLLVCSLSLVWVSISLFPEFTCCFIWLTLVQVLVDSASDLFQGTLID